MVENAAKIERADGVCTFGHRRAGRSAPNHKAAVVVSARVQRLATTPPRMRERRRMGFFDMIEEFCPGLA